MNDIKSNLVSLRSEINKYREENRAFILADILAVEIAMNLVEFALKKSRPITIEEEIWFKATYPIAYSFDGTKWENIYILYKELINYAEMKNYFRGVIPKVEW